MPPQNPLPSDPNSPPFVQNPYLRPRVDDPNARPHIILPVPNRPRLRMHQLPPPLPPTFLERAIPLPLRNLALHTMRILFYMYYMAPLNSHPLPQLTFALLLLPLYLLLRLIHVLYHQQRLPNESLLVSSLYALKFYTRTLPRFFVRILQILYCIYFRLVVMPLLDLIIPSIPSSTTSTKVLLNYAVLCTRPYLHAVL